MYISNAIQEQRTPRPKARRTNAKLIEMKISQYIRTNFDDISILKNRLASSTTHFKIKSEKQMKESNEEDRQVLARIFTARIFTLLLHFH
jgi:hypothetical protein